MNIWEEIEWHKFLNSFNKKETNFMELYFDVDFLDFIDQNIYNIEYRVKDIFKTYNK